MPSVSIEHLNEARVRSGNLGGRPRKPTVTEARDHALEQLMPKALKALDAALDEGGPGAVRAAVTVLQYRWGKPDEHLTITPGLSQDADLRSMTDAELDGLRRELRAQLDASALPPGS